MRQKSFAFKFFSDKWLRTKSRINNIRSIKIAYIFFIFSGKYLYKKILKYYKYYKDTKNDKKNHREDLLGMRQKIIYRKMGTELDW